MSVDMRSLSEHRRRKLDGTETLARERDRRNRFAPPVMDGASLREHPERCVNSAKGLSARIDSGKEGTAPIMKDLFLSKAMLPLRVISAVGVDRLCAVASNEPPSRTRIANAKLPFDAP